MSDDVVLIIGSGSIGHTARVVGLIGRLDANIKIATPNDLVNQAHEEINLLNFIDNDTICHHSIKEDPHNPASQHAKEKRNKYSNNRYGSPFNIGGKG